MKNEKGGYSLTELLTVLFAITIFITITSTWLVNAYKFVKCDFQSPYKGEIVHAVGIFTPLCVITAWINEK